MWPGRINVTCELCFTYVMAKRTLIVSESDVPPIKKSKKVSRGGRDVLKAFSSNTNGGSSSTRLSTTKAKARHTGMFRLLVFFCCSLPLKEKEKSSGGVDLSGYMSTLVHSASSGETSEIEKPPGMILYSLFQSIF